jgi:hypothetical protein
MTERLGLNNGSLEAVSESILAWFKARGAGWQEELNGVLEFYIHTVEHPASEPEPPIQRGPLEP